MVLRSAPHLISLLTGNPVTTGVNQGIRLVLVRVLRVDVTAATSRSRGSGQEMGARMMAPGPVSMSAIEGLPSGSISDSDEISSEEGEEGA